jgi:Domain of unknown function (DUF1707)/Cell wall-active antibiotics response 4TMS YvqF
MNDYRVRVSDVEREAVVARLNAATGEGRLTMDEFGDRAAQAYAARTQGELVRLVEDLPATFAPRPTAGPPVIEHNPIGTVKRGGRWRIDRETHVGTTLGAIKLDLTEAEIGVPEVTLRVRAFVGAVKVWIPRGVRVEVTGRSYLGSRRVDTEAPADEHAPVLRLHIETVIGSVKVYCA